MKIIFFTLILFACYYPINAHAEKDSQELKATFIRDGNICVKQGNIEKQITTKGNAHSPKWSHDGKWIAYRRNGIWAYNVETEKTYQVYHTDVEFQWAPNRNIIAFNAHGVLNVSNLEDVTKREFQNVSLGTDSFAWLPDGSGFLVSSSAILLPTGWSDIQLFKVPLEGNMDFANAEHFFTIPVNEEELFAVSATNFKWSPDGKWIAFFGIPTASISMDSNYLLLLSSDGKRFMNVDQMLAQDYWMKWAPHKNFLGYIEGSGRFAVNNKQLKVKELPAIQIPSFTPEGYIDRGFTWLNDHTTTVSRAVESEWSNNPKERPLPYLVQVNIDSGNQKQITEPPSGYGDFAPEFNRNEKVLAWVRSNRNQADVWISKSDGSDAELWIRDVGNEIVDWYNADDVIKIYDGKPTR
jgi:dipeptidyl aminopeptidase/acylaminoacyl peptidase